MSRFLTMKQASERVGNISEETMRRLAREGHLPVRRIGRRTVISDVLLDEWADTPGDVRDTVYPGVALRHGDP